MDTAEKYPVPPRRRDLRQHRAHHRHWSRRSSDRADWILASKIAGPGNGISHVRDGNLAQPAKAHRRRPRCQPERLGDRPVGPPLVKNWRSYGRTIFRPAWLPHQEESFTAGGNPEVLDELVRAGKIRHRPVQRDALGNS